jgi:hypothetical protein
MNLRSLGKVKQWLLQENETPWRDPRSTDREITVHYWNGSAPEGRQIRDISESGAYIITPERWYIGTIVRIVLQGNQKAMPVDGTSPSFPSICVPGRMVRQGSDGVAVEFVFRNKDEASEFRTFLASIPCQPARVAPSNATSRPQGQALVEFSLIIPLLFLLAVNAVNFGGFIFAWITIANAARGAAEYMVMSSASPGAVTPATLAQITALVTTDVSSLLNRASVVVAVCQNNTTAANGCTTLFDPEAPTYTLATVDVTYTYKPLIPLFSFPKMGIGATLPSTIIHRKAVMRMLQ